MILHLICQYDSPNVQAIGEEVQQLGQSLPYRMQFYLWLTLRKEF